MRFVFAAALLVACQGKMLAEPGGMAAPQGSAPCDLNPSGICYPTDHIGSAALVLDSAGNPVRRGERLANARFWGFRAQSALAPIDTTQPPDVVSLADYYDPGQELGPNGGGLSVIHVMVNVSWCGPSNEEADFVSGANYTGQNTGQASFAQELAPLGVVFVEILSEGKVDQPATLPDLLAWITEHRINYTAVLDENTADSVLASEFPYAVIPFWIDLDARSMEILAIGAGFDSQLDMTLKKWVAWEQTHAPL